MMKERPMKVRANATGQRSAQKGVMLLEALVAILIFTLGIFIACRTPARPRRKEPCENTALRSKVSFIEIKSGTIAKPRFSTHACKVGILGVLACLLRCAPIYPDLW